MDLSATSPLLPILLPVTHPARSGFLKPGRCQELHSRHLNFFKDFYLLIHKRHRERGRDTGRGRSRLLRRAQYGTWSQDPRTMTWAKGRPSTTEPHPGVPPESFLYSRQEKGGMVKEKRPEWPLAASLAPSTDSPANTPPCIPLASTVSPGCPYVRKDLWEL